MMLNSCAPTQEHPLDLAVAMDVLVGHYYPRVFMGCVLVASDHQILFAKGYGAANVEWGVRNSCSTKFRIGSITKQFTAAAILLLEEKGKLHTSHPIRQYMRHLPTAWKDITIYHLLTHTSGIPNFTGFPDFDSTKMIPSSGEKTLLRFREKPLESEPGKQHLYSSSGYILLGLLIHQVSGQAYDRFLQESIFDPLGMKDTGYDFNSKLLFKRATGYKRRGGQIINADYMDMSMPFSAGGLYSTAEDLWRWHQGLFGGAVLSPQVLEKMTQPFLADYACGLLVRRINGREVIEHGSGIEGFNSYVSYHPGNRLTCVALANVTTGALETIVAQLADLVHGTASPTSVADLDTLEMSKAW